MSSLENWGGRSFMGPTFPTPSVPQQCTGDKDWWSTVVEWKGGTPDPPKSVCYIDNFGKTHDVASFTHQAIMTQGIY